MAHYPCVWLKYLNTTHTVYIVAIHLTLMNVQKSIEKQGFCLHVGTCKLLRTVDTTSHVTLRTSDHAMTLEVHAIKISSTYYQAALEKDITHLLPLAFYVTTLVYTQRYRLVIFSSIAL